MATKFPNEELIRRAVDLNVRYYSDMSQLMATYVKDLMDTFSQAANQFQGGQSAPRTAASTASAGAKAQPAPVMVLEAEAGKPALGVFLVENHLNQNISTKVAPSAFFDASGHEVKPAVVFDPEAVTLRPGEQVLVRVKAHIDDSFAPDVSYEGSLNIPELTGSRVRIVLRRRPASEGG